MPVGPTELAIVPLILLVVFGAGRVSEVGSALGKAVRALRDAFKEHTSGAPQGEADQAKGRKW